uniref:SFRICE_035460 n=1 Tax=Spodoptera frugiperda TaxID=7108 RepID=A0A2H1VZG0_SPOFR
MTTSAFKCKHTNSDSDTRHQYDYTNQEPLGIPDNHASLGLSSRIAAMSPANHPPIDSNAPKSFAQVKIADTTLTRRSESESKILTWKPYTSTSKRGQNNDNFKIVFPGPTSEDFKLEIPEHCRKIGICEDVPNYPQDLADKAISQLTRIGALQQDKLDIPTLPDIAQRVGSHEETIELCKFEEKVIYLCSKEPMSLKADFCLSIFWSFGTCTVWSAKLLEATSIWFSGTETRYLAIDKLLIKHRGCIYKHISPHALDTQTRNNNLWITQRIAPCGDRTHYTLRGSWLLSHSANRALD